MITVCAILFLCAITDINFYDAYRAVKFSSSFKLFRSCPLLKVLHAYQNFLEHNSKAPSYRWMEQLGESCVKQRWRILLLLVIFSILVEQSYHGIVGRPFAAVLFPMVPMHDVLQQKKYIVTPDVFSGKWVGWTENVILTFCVTNCVRDKLRRHLISSKFYRRRNNNKVDSIKTEHSYCSFASLKWSRKLFVHHAFSIAGHKVLSPLFNL